MTIEDEFECREKSFSEVFLLDILDNQDSDAKIKFNMFSSHYSCNRNKLQIEFMMDEFELVVAYEHKFENWVN